MKAGEKPRPQTVDEITKAYSMLSDSEKLIINGSLSALVARAALDQEKESA